VKSSRYFTLLACFRRAIFKLIGMPDSKTLLRRGTRTTAITSIQVYNVAKSKTYLAFPSTNPGLFQPDPAKLTDIAIYAVRYTLRQHCRL
jgi:hypothetical protein